MFIRFWCVTLKEKFRIKMMVAKNVQQIVMLFFQNFTDFLDVQCVYYSDTYISYGSLAKKPQTDNGHMEKLFHL